jgi:hypothetical protein
MTDELNRRKQEYDTAQKMGARVERMCNEDGWRHHFIQMIQRRRDRAQSMVNDLTSDERMTDFNRGILEICDEILDYEEEKKKQALAIMRKNANPKS